MLPFIRGWTDVQRTPRTNRRLGATLAFVAGAANAGGFLAVGQYTSHMTGVMSSLADHLALGQFLLAGAALAALLTFTAGAMSTALLVNWAQRRQLHSSYSLPLLLEASLLMVFGVMGASLGLHSALLLPATVLLLCFTMGLQNAVITKISRAEIRTTHVTGLVTDFGIEVGKLLYWNRSHAALAAGVVRANRDKLQIHILLIGAFFFGGVAGGYGFLKIGFGTAIPMAVVLALVALAPRVWRAQ